MKLLSISALLLAAATQAWVPSPLTTTSSTPRGATVVQMSPENSQFRSSLSSNSMGSSTNSTTITPPPAATASTTEEKEAGPIPPPPTSRETEEDSADFEAKLDALLADLNAMEEGMTGASSTTSADSAIDAFAKFVDMDSPAVMNKPGAQNNKNHFKFLEQLSSNANMPKLPKEQVDQAVKVAKQGMSVLVKGVNVVAESSLEAVNAMNTTSVGKTDLTYEQALNKVGKSAVGLIKFLGDVLGESTEYVTKEMQQQQSLALKKREEKIKLENELEVQRLLEQQGIVEEGVWHTFSSVAAQKELAAATKEVEKRTSALAAATPTDTAETKAQKQQELSLELDRLVQSARSVMSKATLSKERIQDFKSSAAFVMANIQDKIDAQAQQVKAELELNRPQFTNHHKQEVKKVSDNKPFFLGKEE